MNSAKATIKGVVGRTTRPAYRRAAEKKRASSITRARRSKTILLVTMSV